MWSAKARTSYSHGPNWPSEFFKHFLSEAFFAALLLAAKPCFSQDRSWLYWSHKCPVCDRWGCAGHNLTGQALAGHSPSWQQQAQAHLQHLHWHRAGGQLCRKHPAPFAPVENPIKRNWRSEPFPMASQNLPDGISNHEKGLNDPDENGGRAGKVLSSADRFWIEALPVYAQISPHRIWNFDLQMQITLKCGNYAEINTQACSLF